MRLYIDTNEIVLVKDIKGNILCLNSHSLLEKPERLTLRMKIHELIFNEKYFWLDRNILVRVKKEDI